MSFPAPDRQVFIPGPASADDVRVERMYYTLCKVCGTAFNDWSDSPAEARRNRRYHLEWHKRSVEDGAP